MILEIIDQLANTSSINQKLEILSVNKNNQTLKDVFRLAYDPKIKFWIKIRPAIADTIATEYTALCNVLETIESVICTRTITGNAAIEFISNQLSLLTQSDQEVLYRILERDLKCGVNAKLINKTWKALVREYPIMLCAKYNSKTEKAIDFKDGVFFQKKEDGVRINLEFDNGKFVSAITRNGNLLDLACFNNYPIYTQERVILDGELLYVPNGRIADRKIGNGIITKAIRNTIALEESKQLIFVCWDCIPYNDFIQEKCLLKYKQRFERLQKIIPEDSAVYKIVQTEKVFSKFELIEKYKRNISLGYEGGILKTFDSIWEPTRSKYCLKLKAEDSFDAVITAIVEGTGKYLNKLGAFEIQSSDGIVVSSVGTGFTDKQREEYFTNEMLGQIVSVKYNQLIQAKDNTWSVFLPVFDCIRYDKTTANSLDEIYTNQDKI